MLNRKRNFQKRWAILIKSKLILLNWTKKSYDKFKKMLLTLIQKQNWQEEEKENLNSTL